MISSIFLIIIYVVILSFILKNTDKIKLAFTNPYIIAAFVIGLFLIFYVVFTEISDISKFNKKRNKMPKWANQCPDQWSKVNNLCVNDFNIGGKCGSTNFDNYTKKQKCKWSKKCQSPWEGIDDIC